MSTKNTISCPGCDGVLRVSANVVSDGKDYRYFLCPRCQDVASQERGSEAWRLRGRPAAELAELVATLQRLAVDQWIEVSASRAPLTTKLAKVPDHRGEPLAIREHSAKLPAARIGGGDGAPALTTRLAAAPDHRGEPPAIREHTARLPGTWSGAGADARPADPASAEGADEPAGKAPATCAAAPVAER